MRRAIMIAALTGCIQTGTITCPDGRICPDNTVCVRVTDPDLALCAEPAQLQQCAGLPSHARCSDGGRCYDGVCLPTACGNGRVDRIDASDPYDVDGEVCDDSNERSGDGCASDCRSNETCGNGITDLVNGEGCDDGDQRSSNGCASGCQPERPRWQQRAIDPSVNDSAAFAYDIARDRVVMFGGLLGAGLSNETWEWNGASWSRANPPVSPPPRTRAAMAYDAARHRIVMVGGVGKPVGLDDMWLWDGTSWHQPAVEAPPARLDHAMVYDSRRARVVLFGGRYSGTQAPLNDTWEWDGAVWSRNDIAAPHRASHAMAYDPSRGVTVMFGGIAADDDVYEYDGVAWRAAPYTGRRPATRADAALAYDPISRSVILIGRVGVPPLIDAWSWDGHEWREIAVPVDPPFGGPVAITEDRRARLSLFGRSVHPTSHWFWNGTSWPMRSAASKDAGGYAAALDPLRGRIVGATAAGAFLELDGAAWRDIATPGAGVSSPALAYDPTRSYTLMFGTADSPDPAGATWSWDGVTWTLHSPATRPPRRDGHRLAFDPATSRVVMFGGTEQNSDTWAWDGTDWRAQTPGQRPSPRAQLGFATDLRAKTIVLFGGVDAGGQTLGDTWLWTGADWIEQHPASQPSPRSGGAMAWDASRAKVILVGGHSADGEVLNDVWEWDGATWSRQAAVSSPRRFGHAVASAIGGGVMLFGGTTFDSVPMIDSHLLRWDGATAVESCRNTFDEDGDGLAGCTDPDCWWVCSPLCPPHTTCPASAPRCGDGTCNPALEDCWICPTDCTCVATCGDTRCDAEEDAASCPGDCP